MLCQDCGQRAAKFIYVNRKRGVRIVVKKDKNHGLCTACWRARLDAERARQLGEREVANRAA